MVYNLSLLNNADVCLPFPALCPSNMPTSSAQPMMKAVRCTQRCTVSSPYAAISECTAGRPWKRGKAGAVRMTMAGCDVRA